MKDEEQVLLATALAMQLACGLNENELCELIRFVNQILCSLNSLRGRKNPVQ